MFITHGNRFLFERTLNQSNDFQFLVSIFFYHSKQDIKAIYFFLIEIKRTKAVIPIKNIKLLFMFQKRTRPFGRGNKKKKEINFGNHFGRRAVLKIEKEKNPVKI